MTRPEQHRQSGELSAGPSGRQFDTRERVGDLFLNPLHDEDLDNLQGPDSPVVLRVGDLELDEDGRQVRRAGAVVELTPTEYKLCRYLMVNARRVLSKQQILEHVWDYDYTGDTGLVETCISYLRKKLEHQGSPPLIQTVRGFGYTIRPGSG